MTVVVGLDPGTNRFGIGSIIAEPHGLSALRWQVLEPPARPYAERLHWIGNELRRWLTTEMQLAMLDGPAHSQGFAIAMEEGFVRGRDATQKLSEVRGVAQWMCTALGLTVARYEGTSVKLAVTGQGNADKQQVARLVRAQLRLDVDLAEDAADALAVAIAHAQRLAGLTPAMNRAPKPPRRRR